MAKKLYEEASVQAIADAIRVKNGSIEKYKIAEMGVAIKALSGETETYTFSQERTEVSKFLSEVTYNPADYTTSSIPNYVTTTSSKTLVSSRRVTLMTSPVIATSSLCIPRYENTKVCASSGTSKV